MVDLIRIKKGPWQYIPGQSGSRGGMINPVLYFLPFGNVMQESGGINGFFGSKFASQTGFFGEIAQIIMLQYQNIGDSSHINMVLESMLAVLYSFFIIRIGFQIFVILFIIQKQFNSFQLCAPCIVFCFRHYIRADCEKFCHNSNNIRLPELAESGCFALSPRIHRHLWFLCL
ncbi:hypothetical protein SDC9_193067 [bioreactor metagenome]|uniref:Uncharacterized protein n=1 Tax=bioreactor metagenome TaxID=1076179 RepID=A0A645I2W7_9ZZZZ